MKKYVMSLIAVVVAVVASSFTSGLIKINSTKKGSVTIGPRWYNFYGSNSFEMTDPSYYGLDENNWPDCPPAVGSVYCEIYAHPSHKDENEPDLRTISNYRMTGVVGP